MPSDRDLIRRGEAKAAMADCFQDGFDYPSEAASLAAQEALDAVPAADGEPGIIHRRIAVLRELVGKRVPGEHSIAEIELDALEDLLDADLTSRDAAQREE